MKREICDDSPTIPQHTFSVSTQFRYMAYLVTGGRGFIGSHLIKTMVEQGEEVVVLTSQQLPLSTQKGIKYVYGDITKEESLHDIFRTNNIDGIFHLAAVGNAMLSDKNPKKFNDININGTLNILKAANEAEVDNVVFSSSSLVYGRVDDEMVSENSTLNPLTPYAVSKIAGEFYCKMFAELYGMNIAILRYFNVYGPGQDASSEFAAAIPKFIHLIRRHESPVIYGDGTQERDFVYVEDIVSANLLAMNNSSIGTYNVGMGKSHSLNQIVKTIMDVSGIEVDISYTESRGNEVRKVVSDISNARKDLGYQPKYDIYQGIKETWESIQK